MENFLTGFRELFYAEGLQIIKAVETDLSHLERGTGNQAMYEHLYWLIKTLKVDSSIYGFSEMHDVCLGLSVVYDEIRKDRMQSTPRLLEISSQCARFIAGYLENRGLLDRRHKEIHKMLTRELNLLTDSAKHPVINQVIGKRTRQVIRDKKRRFSQTIRIHRHSQKFCATRHG